MISGLAALFAACVLAGLVYWFQRRRPPIRTRWIIGAVVLPFASIAYMWGIFVLYGIHCEAVRGVDLGLGDSWRVPLTHGYSLTMIDTPDQAFVETPNGGQAHHGLTRIGSSERFVAVEHDGHFFLTEVRSGSESWLTTEPDLQSAVQKAGEATIELLPPAVYYTNHRWGLADTVAGGVAFVPPGLVFLLFAWRFVRFAFASQVAQA